MTSPVRYTIRCDNCDRALDKEENLIAHAVVHHGYTVDAANREVPKAGRRSNRKRKAAV